MKKPPNLYPWHRKKGTSMAFREWVRRPTGPPTQGRISLMQIDAAIQNEFLFDDHGDWQEASDKQEQTPADFSTGASHCYALRCLILSSIACAAAAKVRRLISTPTSFRFLTVRPGKMFVHFDTNPQAFEIVMARKS